MYKDIFVKNNTAIFNLDGAVLVNKYVLELAINSILRAADVTTVFDKSPEDTPLKRKWEILIDQNNLDMRLTPQELADKTLTLYLDLMKNKNYKIRDGFFEFILELRKLNVKTGLLSRYNENITNMILGYAEITDVFDQVLFSSNNDLKQLSKKDYSVLCKKLGGNIKHCLIFESSIDGVKKALKTKAKVFAVHYGNYERSFEQDYPLGITGYIENYTVFVGNMDLTMDEQFKSFVYQYLRENKLLSEEEIAKYEKENNAENLRPSSDLNVE